MSILPSIPILVSLNSTPTSLQKPMPLLQHRPTLFLEALDSALAFALAVVGAGFSNAGQAFHLEMTKQKRIFAAEQTKKKHDLTPTDCGPPWAPL